MFIYYKSGAKTYSKILPEGMIDAGEPPTEDHKWNGSEYVKDNDLILNNIRNKRNQLLTKSDWMTCSDSPEMNDAWKTYRQKLRDLPASNSDPEKIVFPTKP